MSGLKSVVRWAAMVFAAVVVWAGGPEARAQISFANNLESELETIVDGFHEHEGFSGVVLVAVGDSVVLNKAWGMASVELDVPNRTDHRFLVASVSKTFTALATMRLVDFGLIDLETSILEYLPESGLDERITVHQLLTHSSGLHRDLLPGTGRTRREHFSTSDRLSLVREQGLRFSPGRRYAYSSHGYVVLAAMIEEITALPLDAALDALVFLPLGMSNTGLEVDGRIVPGRANRYIDLLGQLQPAVFEDPTFAYGSGSVSTTSSDMLRFVRSMMSDDFLTAESRGAMISDHIRGNGYGVRPYTYGTGERIGKGGGAGIGYEGGTSGVAAVFNLFLDHETAVIVLANKTPFGMNAMTNPLNNTALGYPPPRIEHRDGSALFQTIVNTDTDQALAVAERIREAGDSHLLLGFSDLWQVGYGLFLHHRLDESEAVMRYLAEVDPINHVWAVIAEIRALKGDVEGACEAHASALAMDEGPIDALGFDCLEDSGGG